jgi:hypothetical protein
VPIQVNERALQYRIEDEDEQVWFSFYAQRGVKYKVSVDLQNDAAKDSTWLEDSVVCVFTSEDQHLPGGQALDEQECEGPNGGPPCHSLYCNDDTAVSLGSQMKWTEDVGRPRYIAVYGRRKDEVGIFNVSVTTSCPAPTDNTLVDDTSDDDQTQRKYLTDETTGHKTGWYDDIRAQNPAKPCSDNFVGDTCSFVCDAAKGYVPRNSSHDVDVPAVRVCRPPPCARPTNCTQAELNRNGAFDDNHCILKPPEPEPEPEPELEPEPEPKLEGEAEPERGHLLFEREAATEEVSSSRRPPVDWSAHQRSLQEALAAAGLEPPPLTEEDDDGDDGEEAGGNQQPCADEGAGLEGGEADTEAEACRWSSAMEELQELAKTLDAAALRAEVERLRDDHSDVSK